MMEIIKFIAQDDRHFIGALAILMSIFLGSAMVIASIGYAISLARGFEQGGNDDNDTKHSD